MSRDIAAEIENEYGEITFNHPMIEFGYNKIVINQKFDIYMILFLVIVLGAIVTFFLMIGIPFPWYFVPAAFIFIVSLFYFYSNRFDKTTIDFLSKELIIENRLPFINDFRRLLNRQSLIPFNEIGYFMTDNKDPNFMLPGRSLFNIQMRRTSLYVTPKFKTPILLVSFQFEREARRLGELLQFYIVGKPGIIK